MDSDDPQELHARVRLLMANAHSTAILRMCQFTAEHAESLDHAFECELIEESKTGIKYDMDAPVQDIYATAVSLEKRLRAAVVYVSRLSDLVIAETLTNPKAYPGGQNT